MSASSVGRHIDLQDEYKSIFNSSLLCLLEAHAKLKQAKYKKEPADARSFFFWAHAVHARGSDSHQNVLSLISYSHILENR